MTGEGGHTDEGGWPLRDQIEPGRPVDGTGSPSTFAQMTWLSLWPNLGTGLGQGDGQVQAKGEGHSEEAKIGRAPWFLIQGFNSLGLGLW